MQRIESLIIKVNRLAKALEKGLSTKQNATASIKEDLTYLTYIAIPKNITEQFDQRELMLRLEALKLIAKKNELTPQQYLSLEQVCRCIHDKVNPQLNLQPAELF